MVVKASVVVSQGITGVQLDGFTVVNYRLLIIAYLTVGITSVEVGQGITGVQLDGFVVISYRFVIIAYLTVGITALVVGISIVWVQFNGLVKFVGLEFTLTPDDEYNGEYPENPETNDETSEVRI